MWTKQLLGSTLLAGIAAMAVSLPTNASTIAYWNLDEASGNYVDMAGSNDLARVGGTQDTAHVLAVNGGGAADLNNQDASDGRTSDIASQTALRATGPHISALDLSATGWTLEMYFRTDNSARQFLTSNNPSGNPNTKAWDLELGNVTAGKLSFRIQGAANNASATINAATNIADNQFHHIAVTWDPTANVDGLVSIYVDGQLDGSGAGLGVLDATGAGQFFYVGGFALSNGTFSSSLGTTGQIDEVRISNAVLAPSQFLNAVPEPSSAALLAGGLAGLSVMKRRRRPTD